MIDGSKNAIVKVAFQLKGLVCEKRSKVEWLWSLLYMLMLFKALKTGFVENKGQSGPLSVVSKTQGKCQLSVKF